MVCCLLFGGCERAARLIESGYRMTITRGMDGRAPVRPPLRPLSTGIRHRFSGIRHRFLSAVRGAQSRGFARFATRLNPLTPCFVTGKNFLRMRPGAGNGLPISQRFNYPPPLQKIFRLNAALLRTRVGFAPVNSTICPSNESSLQCQKLTRALPPLPLRVGAGLNELGAFQ